MANVQDLFREYIHLDRKRSGDGVSPAEFERWRKLKQALARTFSGGPPTGAEDRRESVRVPTRMKVDFDSREGLMQALMTNLSRGGFFISTAFPQTPGTRFELRVRVQSSGEMLEVPVQVVSTHVGPGFETGSTGMGLRVLNPSPEMRKKLDDLYAEVALAEAAARE